MESSARRRLAAISRHLLQPPALIPSNGPRPNQLSADSELLERAPVVIGGMVLDIQAIPSEEPSPGTTTPGKVRYVNGGVARNIAECMSKLGTKPFIISVIGADMAGEQLMKYWKSTGLPTEGILKLEGVTTPVVSNVFGCKGESVAAVASVDAVETYLTSGWIEQFHRNIYGAPVVMVDANLPPQTLEFACRMAVGAGVPVWFEPVSVIKSSRIASVANLVACTSPNEAELIAMATVLSPQTKFEGINLEEIKGLPVEDLFQMLKPAIVSLFDKGIKLLLITLGSYGLFLCHSRNLDFSRNNSNLNLTTDRFLRQLYQEVNNIYYNQCFTIGSSEFCAFHFPAIPAEVVSVIGAGDCLVGGTLAGICAGLDVARSVAVGVVAAKGAVESENNVPDKFLVTNIQEKVKEVLSRVKPLLF
ncbi:hypothetical protein LUZ61_001484 [Rhynchospora tenuis]|uniref:Carbohydrate kinase PfkB domain-containing protein n=1 Tax=Rhynchospora tenuis TaxID=198213 RepID=A0AAD6EQU8_9POAL|nr:hypothetical protein LUZ61_001484 [Rhynchospora tenuis]